MIAIDENWTPTSENINQLPAPLRDYIHELSARADPAGDVQDKVMYRDQSKALEKRYTKARDLLLSAFGALSARGIEKSLAEAIDEFLNPR